MGNQNDVHVYSENDLSDSFPLIYHYPDLKYNTPHVMVNNLFQVSVM